MSNLKITIMARFNLISNNPDIKDFFINGKRVTESEYFDAYHIVMNPLIFPYRYRVYCRSFIDSLWRIHYSRNLYTFKAYGYSED